MDMLLLIISLVLGIITGVLIFQYRISRSRIDRLRWRTARLQGELYQHHPAETIFEDKSSKELKTELLKINTPKVFWYFDENIVVSLHNQIQEDFRLDSIEEETIGKKEGEIGVDKIFKASIGKGESKRRLEKLTFSENIETAYNDLEKFLYVFSSIYNHFILPTATAIQNPVKTEKLLYYENNILSREGWTKTRLSDNSNVRMSCLRHA